MIVAIVGYDMRVRVRVLGEPYAAMAVVNIRAAREAKEGPGDVIIGSRLAVCPYSGTRLPISLPSNSTA